MKKFFLIMAASILIFACSKEEDTSIDEPSGQVIELTAVNEPTDGNAITRTRPLYSQEAIQEIERVSIYVFSYNASSSDYFYLKTYTVSGWNKGSSFMRFAVPDNDKLAAGDYQFLAIGREATDNYRIPTPVVGTTKINDMIAHITTPGQESEIFAGTKLVTVSSQGIRITMQMTRKVAGVLGYFKNVPYDINGSAVKYLRLTFTNADTAVILATGNGSNPTNASYMLINADLSGQAKNTDLGVYTGNDLSAQGVVKVDNSQLYGNFMLPVGNITLTLGLYDASGNALKTWSVQDNGNTTFNITANHFYGLGQKVSKGDVTGGGTPDPGDDDAPVDLLKDQVIVITVDPNWNTIHNLTIN